jgi:hypothetical protein
MRIHLRRGFALLPILCFVSQCAFTATAGYGTNLTGAVKKQGSSASVSSDGTKSSTFLQGGLKDDESMKSSLKLLPGKAERRQELQSGVEKGHPSSPEPLNVTQFGGPLRYEPGQPAQSGTIWSQAARSGVIPPISSYTLTPGTSVWVAPGYEVSHQTLQVENVRSVAHTENYTAISSRNGVTSWIPGYEVSTSQTYEICPVYPVRSGIATYAPGYDVTLITSVVVPPSMTTSGSEIRSYGTTTSDTYQIARSTSRSGVVCWSPGFEVSIESAGVVKNTLGGVWTAPSAPQQELRAQEEKLLPKPELAQAIAAPLPMVAQAKLMPGLKAASVAANWQDWYARVAEAVYCRWQYAEVNAGQVRVRVEADRYHNLFCQGFAPANGTQVDVNYDSAFREAVVHAINSVTKFEVPDFPADANCGEVTFEMDMKRSIDGTSGYQIAKAPKP